MRNTFLLLLLLSSCCITAQNKKGSFYKPAPGRFTPVNDFAFLLTTTQNRSLSKKIKRYRDSTGNVIAIITQDNLKDAANNQAYSIEEVALHYFDNWKIGDKENNNGILILIATQDRKVRITTGKGIDDLLTDADCQSIIDHSILPNFKKLDYYTGLEDAVQNIIETVSGAPTSSQEDIVVNKPVNTTNSYTYDNTANKPEASGTMLLVAVIAVIFLITLAGLLFNRTQEQVISSDPYPYYPERSWYWWLLPGWLMHDHYNHRYGNNSYGNSSPASYDNNDSSSSSGSSGGDSSFGGGSSDGGGASGSW